MKADYGLDAPGIVYAMGVGGAACLVLGIAGRMYANGNAVYGFASAFIWIGASYVVTASLMYLSSRYGKLRACEALLDRLSIARNATVLDAGCGHGLMLIGAAKRVNDGRAVGIDLWSQKDQRANSAGATIANAQAEGVAARVSVESADVRALPFRDATFDAVTSSLVLHNIHSREERRRAIAELVRVVKAGGHIGIMDIAHVGQYAADLREAGVAEVRTHGITPWIFPPTRVLTARK